MEYKIAIIGRHETVLGFKAVGVVTFSVSNSEEAKKALDVIRTQEKYAIVFITEDWAELIEDKIKEFEGRALPVICAIPTQHGPTGRSIKDLKKIVEQAVGSDILSK